MNFSDFESSCSGGHILVYICIYFDGGEADIQQTVNR